MIKKNILGYSLYIFMLIATIACSSLSPEATQQSFHITYLDEYVLYNDSIFNDSRIGGLSGIDYHQKQNAFYIVCDDAKKPRFYKVSITLKNNKFDTVIFDQLVKIKDQNDQLLNTSVLDLEAIRSFSNDQLIFTSEGSIKHNYNPSIFVTDSIGNYLQHFKLPSHFLVDSTSKNIPRHNGVFEGLTRNISNTGYWAAMELPLQSDGDEPTIRSSGAPVRITHFDTSSKQADYQFTYILDPLTKDPKGKFGVNGITGLLQLTKDQFLIIERGYAAGFGTQGNTVRIYVCHISNVTNTLNIDSLADHKIKSASKQLLFDFESVRNQLTDRIIDNIEGVTLGPILDNGNLSLILIADNNFNPSSEQINQFILLELTKTF